MGEYERLKKQKEEILRKEKNKPVTSLVIAVDFDGTIAETKYPHIVQIYADAIFHIRLWRQQGHKVILWTCREGQALKAAVDACTANGIEFDTVNDNLIGSRMKYGVNSRKVTADIYIDDKSTRRWDLSDV